jgi:glycerophosphoryl diester phosphodiesterase
MKNTREGIIAHRGESYDAPENTLAAIQLAWERGASSVEIDIHLSKDGQIVVIHDEDTARVANRKLILKDSLTEELRKLDVGSFKEAKWKGEQIPLLQEVLCTVPENGRLIIEIKSNAAPLPRLKELLEKSKLNEQQIEIIAFDSKVLAKAKQLMPEYKMLWLLDLDYYWPWWLIFLSKKRLIKKLKALNLQGVNVWAGKMLSADFIRTFQEAGLLVYTWTVDDPAQARQLRDNRIDAITTNRAAWITEQISKNK